MARGRASGYDAQREAILQQAAALFARHGYPATSMNQVAEACGLSKATLYHYVRDKHGLLLMITAGHVARLDPPLRRAFSDGGEFELDFRWRCRNGPHPPERC